MNRFELRVTGCEFRIKGKGLRVEDWGPRMKYGETLRVSSYESRVSSNKVEAKGRRLEKEIAVKQVRGPSRLTNQATAGRTGKCL
jgi:hypothetical protein